MIRSYRTEAIVIRRVNLGETDRILTLLTKDRGKLSVIAKGARRIKSSMQGAAELCSYSSFQLALGTNLDVVTQVELKNAFLGLRGSLDRVSRALYALELCSEFLEEKQPQQNLFLLLLSALYVLESATPLDWIIGGFEVQAMAVLGYAPQVQFCAACGKAPAPGPLRFSPQLGGILCFDCSSRHRDSMRVSQEAIVAIRRLAGTQLASLGREDPPPALVTETRRIIQAHIRYRAEKEMKSSKFIEQLRAEESTLKN